MTLPLRWEQSTQATSHTTPSHSPQQKPTHQHHHPANPLSARLPSHPTFLRAISHGDPYGIPLRIEISVEGNILTFQYFLTTPSVVHDHSTYSNENAAPSCNTQKDPNANETKKRPQSSKQSSDPSKINRPDEKNQNISESSATNVTKNLKTSFAALTTDNPMVKSHMEKKTDPPVSDRIPNKTEEKNDRDTIELNACLQFSNAQTRHKHGVKKILHETAQKGMACVPVNEINKLRTETCTMLQDANAKLIQIGSPMAVNENAFQQKISSAEQFGAQWYQMTLDRTPNKLTKTSQCPDTTSPSIYHPKIAEKDVHLNPPINSNDLSSPTTPKVSYSPIVNTIDASPPHNTIPNNIPYTHVTSDGQHAPMPTTISASNSPDDKVVTPNATDDDRTIARTDNDPNQQTNKREFPQKSSDIPHITIILPSPTSITTTSPSSADTQIPQCLHPPSAHIYLVPSLPSHLIHYTLFPS